MNDPGRFRPRHLLARAALCGAVLAAVLAACGAFPGAVAAVPNRPSLHDEPPAHVRVWQFGMGTIRIDSQGCVSIIATYYQASGNLLDDGRMLVTGCYPHGNGRSGLFIGLYEWQPDQGRWEGAWGYIEDVSLDEDGNLRGCPIHETMRVRP